MTEDDDIEFVTSHARAMGMTSIKRGFIKCRLVHMESRSFILPDLLFSNKLAGAFYSPKFFTPNMISFQGGDGRYDFCIFNLELLNGNDVRVCFFAGDLVKACSDGSFIYRCGYAAAKGKPIPAPCGKWRQSGEQFEVLLYHHTNPEAEKGIRESCELWSSPWNIQGSRKLENIAYCYFSSLPRIRNERDLRDVAMSQSGVAHFLPTDAPYSAEYASALPVPNRSPKDMGRSLSFWVDIETISPSHIWFHSSLSPAYYEVVLPRVYRVGVKPGNVLPIEGKRIALAPEACKRLNYVVVGDASSHDGLAAPYNEEETQSLAKIAQIPPGSEIIRYWHENQNTPLFRGMDVELAQLAGGEG